MTASTWRAARYTASGATIDDGVRRSRRPRIAVVVSGWPRMSETFLVNELLALRAAGMLAAVVATKPGDASSVQPDVELLDRYVTVLPGHGGIGASTDIAVAAIEAAGPVDAVHGYFAHAPAEVAEAVATRMGVPFGFSVHALDVRKVARDELRRRAAAASVVVTCNGDAAATLAGLGIEHRIVHHGVDTDRFRPGPIESPGPGTTIVAVGRLVEKKGFCHLVDAMADVAPEVRLLIVGDGPERVALASRIDSLGLNGRVELLGRMTHDELPELYRSADIAVVPSVIDRNGDRDGLPNVVLEALASGLPVVASDVAAIATAFSPDGPACGVLVPPADSAAIARTIAALVCAPTELRRLGRGARITALTRFDLHRCSTRFCEALEAAYV